jgi:hypothetical protein
MKIAKKIVKATLKFQLKDLWGPINRSVKTYKWFILATIIIVLSIGLIVFLSSPVPVWTQIISQKWESLDFDTLQKSNYPPATMDGSAKRIAMNFYKSSNGNYPLEQNVSVNISSPNMEVFDITDYYQSPAVQYSNDMGGFYLSLFNPVIGQSINLTFKDGLNNLQDKRINLVNNTSLDLQDVKTNNADVTPSVLMIANGMVELSWRLPLDCYFSIHSRDFYANNFPTLNINNSCPHLSSNSVDFQLDSYSLDGGNMVILVTGGMTLLKNGKPLDNQNKQYLIVLKRGDNFTNIQIKIVPSVPSSDVDMTYVLDTFYNLSILNFGNSYSISNSMGEIKLGSQTISTDEYSDINVVSQNGNPAIDIQGSTSNDSSPFVVHFKSLVRSLRINFDEMIKNHWSVFPVEIWSGIIGGLLTILGTYVGYWLGKRNKSTP